MKILKVILLLFLISKSAILPAMDFGGFMSDSCHSEQTEMAACDQHDSDDKHEDKGCCNTTSCDCLCCGHIFTLDAVPELILSLDPVVIITLSNYSFVYAHTFNKGVWQPPRFS